jgi:hypothetical protein
MEDENKRRFGALFDGYDMLLKYAMKTNEDIAEIKARLENHEILLRWLENSTVKIAQSPVA